jgi:hypothetical protein
LEYIVRADEFIVLSFAERRGELACFRESTSRPPSRSSLRSPPLPSLSTPTSTTNSKCKRCHHPLVLVHPLARGASLIEPTSSFPISPFSSFPSSYARPSFPRNASTSSHPAWLIMPSQYCRSRCLPCACARIGTDLASTGTTKSLPSFVSLSPRSSSMASPLLTRHLMYGYRLSTTDPVCARPVSLETMPLELFSRECASPSLPRRLLPSLSPSSLSGRSASLHRCMQGRMADSQMDMPFGSVGLEDLGVERAFSLRDAALEPAVEPLTDFPPLLARFALI